MSIEPSQRLRPATRFWNTTRAEAEMLFPCDRLAPNLMATYFRAVTVRAPSTVVFRWLCQLRVAPYSYDWLDNGGRTSPQQLTPGLEELVLGQKVMTIFTLKDFEPDRSITVATRPTAKMFGEVWVSYMIVPLGAHESRLLAKLRVGYPDGPYGTLLRLLLPPGDLVMMRRQLLNLKRLSERDAADAVELRH
jgi:hypothetical protein